MEALKSLNQMLCRGRTIHIPGCYDALSAKMVQEAGYEAVYVGSYATAASRFGLPDVGALTLNDLCEHAGAVAAAVDIPVLADAEGGFFEAANIWRTVAAFEKAGVCGIHIEDHGGGKHTDFDRQLVPIDVMVGRIKAAIAARRSPEFKIIARTDAVWVHGNLEEARARLLAYQAAGADMVMPTGVTPAQLRELKPDLTCNVVVVGGPEFGSGSDFDGLADVVIYYGLCLFTVSQAMAEVLSDFRRGGYSFSSVGGRYESPGKFEGRLGYCEFAERARLYQPA